MTDTAEEISRIMSELAAEMRANGAEITPEMLEHMTTQVAEQLGETRMHDEFEKHRQAVYTYLDHLEKDNTMAAVFALREADPAGVIAILGSLVNFWGDMLRGDDEAITLGAMAKYTFDAIDRHASCTEDNCTHPEDDES